MPPEKQWDVFLSYSSKDTRIASQIAHDLKSAGLRLWFDQDTIIGGHRLRDQINFGLTHSSKVVILISNRSLQSRWVLNELDSARLRELTEGSVIVIPILIGKFEIKNMPKDMAGKRYIDLRHNFNKKYRIAQDHIIKAISYSDQPDPEGYESVPMGDAAVRRIILSQCSTRLFRGVSLEDTIEMGALFFEKWTDHPDAAELKPALLAFLKRYGEFSLRELIAFFIHHDKDIQDSLGIDTEDRQSFWASEDFFSHISHSLAVFLTLDEAKNTAEFEMGIGQDSVAFRIKPFRHNQ